MQPALSRVGLCSAFLAACLIPRVRAIGQAPASQPATAEVTAEPTAETAGRAAAAGRVLVLAFDALAHDAGNADAVASVIQRSLVVDLGRSRSFHALEGKEVAPDREAAVARGRAEGAQFAVWGTVQFAEGRLRVTGEVVDAARGEAVDHFKLTGTLRDLFELQDQLAERITRRLTATGAPGGEAADPAATRPRAPAAVPPGEPLRVRPRPLDPDWLAPPDDDDDERLDDLARRYNYGYPPYWSVPHVYPYGGYGHYGYGYDGYHSSFYRPYRPIYQHRVYDYTYRGLPNRSPYYGFGPRHIRSFSGPVPLRWYRGY